jgi:hypothetical protein
VYEQCTHRVYSWGSNDASAGTPSDTGASVAQSNPSDNVLFFPFPLPFHHNLSTMNLLLGGR